MIGPIIAICLASIGFGSLVLFVAGSFRLSRQADDYDALLERELDARIAEMMKGRTP